MQGPPHSPQQQPPPPAGGYGQPTHGGSQAFGPDPRFAPGVGHTSCPRCNSSMLSRPSFTWWGGLLGPKLFKHTVCNGCGFGFNGMTGKSNTQAIAIYMGVAFAIVIVIVVLRAM